MLFRNQEKGGAAVEYIIISTFATLLGVGAITIVAKVTKEKLQTIEEKLGVDISSELDFLP